MTADHQQSAPTNSYTPQTEMSVLAAPLLTCIADVKYEKLQWLWPSRVPIGKLTLISGDPGLGKSFITLDMAARISTGNPWPDCASQTNPAGGVILLSAEDGLADTIRPRLDSAGADVSRIMALEAVKHFDFEAGGERQDPFSLTKDIAVLEQAIQDVGDCRLVVIDPISAYLGRTDSHKNAEVRRLLAPLSELAIRHSVALVAVTHLRKGEGPAIYRSMGSVGFVATARAAHCVMKDRDDPTGERRLMLPLKNNLGKDNTGLAYRLESVGDRAAVIKWESEPVTISADEVMAMDNRRRYKETSPARAEAKGWLLELLQDGPVAAKEIMSQAETDGIAKRTMDRVKVDLGVKTYRNGGRQGQWMWKLPDVGADEPPTFKDCQGPTSKSLATFDGYDNL